MARGDALARVLSRFDSKEPSGDGFLLCCPAHDDCKKHGKRSLHASQGRRGVVLKCFAGCETQDIARALGLSMEDLFDDRGEAGGSGARPRPPEHPPERREPVSIPRLARRFRLEESYLRETFRLRQSGAAVAIPYLDRDERGEVRVLFERRRVAWDGQRKVMQPKGVPPALYGLEDLAEFRARPTPALFLVEGESDRWVLRQQRVPVVGVPGASVVNNVLQAEHLAGFEQLWVFQEPGSAGERFQLAVGRRAAELGFHGAIRVVTLGSEAKDPAELWARDPDRFPERFRRACRGAVEWSTSGVDDLVLRMDRVQRRPIDWLWYPYLPLAMTTIMAGKPGRGKSFALAAICAAVSRGAGLPCTDGTTADDRRRVLLFSAEDDPELALRARLEDAGADLERVFVFNLLEQEFEFGGTDFERLEMLVDHLRPSLVAFDPVVSFTGGKVDINQQNQVRGVLRPLARIARTRRVAMLLVAHAGKKQNPVDAVDAIVGSIDFSAAPRSALIAFRDPEASATEQAGVLAHGKHNYSPPGPSLRYLITGTRFAWRGVSPFTAEQLAAAADTRAGERGSIDEAADFLREELAHGDRPAREVLQRARQLGISHMTLARARYAIGVRSRREGFGRDARYLYAMPSADARDDHEREGDQARRGPIAPEDSEDLPF